MEFRSYTCPHCGANLTLELGRRKAVCEYCDSEIIIEDMKTKAAESEPVREPEPERETATQYSAGNEAKERGAYAGYGNAPGYSQAAVSPKSRMVVLILCFFLGIFGVHRFYVGKIGTGILYFFTVALFGFGWIYDMVMILLGAFRDGRGLPVLNWEV